MQVRRLPPRLHDLRSTHPGTLPRPRISMTAQVPHAPAPPLAMACILEEATPTSLGLDLRRQLFTPGRTPLLHETRAPPTTLQETCAPAEDTH